MTCTYVATIVLSCATATLLAQSRPADVPFNIRMIDSGASETAAFVDINNDGRPDIVSSDYWYQAPNWEKHKIRDINWNGQYVDNFSDLPVDVDGDGFTDVVQFGYFSNNIVWMKNPGRAVAASTRPADVAWQSTEIFSGFPTEFAQLVDLDNDGKARELLPQLDLQSRNWNKHVISDHSYGHGIGAGDMNGDGRNDILTPQGWFEAPADVRNGTWAFHQTDWNQHPIAPSGAQRGAPPAPAPPPAAAPGSPAPAPRPAQFGFMYALDVNGDGRRDIITGMGHDYGVCWYEQNADGSWTQRIIDNTWSQAHAPMLADVNSDGQLDLVAGKRYFAHNGSDPGEREPIGLYWYEFSRRERSGASGEARAQRSEPGGVQGTPPIIVVTRHIIDYGGRMGGGMQTDVKDMDGDGDPDIVSGGKAGLFLAENVTKSPKRASSK
jgi:hypothetical protein